MDIVRTVVNLRTRVRAWRGADESVGLVTTMGGIHDGHLALVRAAGERFDHTVATLFVNPKQFGPGEDLGAYPRDEEGDARRLAAEGVDLLFAPPESVMYPEDHSTRVEVAGLESILEGAFRPDFFTGVVTVVAKLLLQVLPDAALFGEKDFQQLRVVQRMVLDLDVPVEIVGVPTVREPDGLALSSRNLYLSVAEREIAPALFATLSAVAESVRTGADPEERERWAESALVSAGFDSVDYVAVRDGATLGRYLGADAAGQGPGRVLAAARLGKARLIDNVAL